ncbi:hypothetical protein DEU56DRAFT_959134 [Suillus clintonianus]|uniref:uncharacterized protein n=1 Tax=Suillus clintonianus TaxID=1904413 RepID=UPI001B887287|nr:uncharacterized protein DEU56DRAFT_959134 [Suillus clintonianus]KAG2126952.1 hypothetical protein DEU56DRAFT_959134 [Suillus clintonianus]
MAPTHHPEEYDPNRCGLVMPARSVRPPLYASRHPEEYDPNRCGLVMPARSVRPPLYASRHPEEYDPNRCGLVMPARSVRPPLYASRHPEEYDLNRCGLVMPARSASNQTYIFFTHPLFLIHANVVCHSHATLARSGSGKRIPLPPQRSRHRRPLMTAPRLLGLSTTMNGVPLLNHRLGLLAKLLVVRLICQGRLLAPQPQSPPHLDGAHDRYRSTKIPADSRRQTERPEDYATPWIRASSARFQRPRKPLNLLHNPTLTPTTSSTTSSGTSSRSASTSCRRPRPRLR